MAGFVGKMAGLGTGGASGAIGAQASSLVGGATAGALGSALMAAQPWLMAAQMVFSAVQAKKAQRAAKAANREQTAVRIKEIYPAEANQAIPILYGQVAATRGVRAYLGFSDFWPLDQEAAAPSRYGETVLGRMPFDRQAPTRVRDVGEAENVRVRYGRYNEFLHMQFILSCGEVESLVDGTIDGRDLNKLYYEGGVRRGRASDGLANMWRERYETASNFAILFTELSGSRNRTATATYDGLSIAGVGAQLPENPAPDGKSSINIRIYDDVPDPMFRGSGVKVPSQTSAAAFAAKAAATDNVSDLLLDYLTNDQYAGIEYGPGLPVATWIERDSFWESKQICGRAMPQQNEREAPPIPPLDIGGENLSGGRIGQNPQSGRAAWNRLWDGQHFGAFNGQLSSGLPFLDATDELLNAVSGAALFFGGQGKIEFRVIDYLRTAEQQSVFTLRDEHFRAKPQESEPEERHTSWTCAYDNFCKDMQEDSATWPRHDDPERPVLLAAAGGVELAGESRLVGVVTATQALSIGRTLTLTGNRRVYTGVYSFAATEEIIKPLEVCRIDSEDMALDVHVLMLAVAVDWFNYEVTFTAHEFVHTDFAPIWAASEELEAVRPARTGQAQQLGVRLLVHGVPVGSVQANTVVQLRATLDGFAGAGTYAWSSSDAGVAFGTPAAANTTATLTATSTITCEFTPAGDDAQGTAVAEFEIAVATSDPPTVELVSLGPTDDYVVYGNGFAAAPTVWAAYAGDAITGAVNATNAVTNLATAGDARIYYAVAYRAGREAGRIGSAMELPYDAADDSTGARNTIAGEPVLF